MSELPIETRRSLHKLPFSSHRNGAIVVDCNSNLRTAIRLSSFQYPKAPRLLSMSGARSFTQTQTELKRKFKKAKHFHANAVAQYEAAEQKFSEDGAALLSAAETLKSSGDSAIQLASDVLDKYGNELMTLHKYKDLVVFNAKHRDYVSEYEGLAFVGFRRRFNAKNLSPDIATAVASKKGVLSTLKDVAQAEARPDDEDSRIFVEDFKWLKQAWNEAILAKGLSLSDYQAVRNFKDTSNKAFHGADSAAAALLVLQSSVPVPDEVQKYKIPLINLLKLLP